MAYPHGTIIEKLGKLYVETREPMTGEPIEIVNHAPIGAKASGYDNLIGRACTVNREGVWKVTGTPIVFKVEGPYVVVAENKIPKPKVRKGGSVRWNLGRWETLTKRGWE